MQKSVCFVALVLLACASVEAKKKEEPGACEVCIKVLEKIDALITKPGNKRKQAKVEKAITKFCKNKKLSQKDKKMCYYFDPIKPEVARPMSIGMPHLKACQKLSKNNPEICEVKFALKVDPKKANFKKMRVKQLKGLLAERGAECKGCTEKSDFIKKVKQVLKDEL
eukprot:g6577.t1